MDTNQATYKDCGHQTMHITVEDGRSMECDILTIIRLNGKDYVALSPKDDPEQAYLYGFGLNDEGNPDLRSLTEKKELDAVVKAFEHWLENADDRVPVDVFSGFLGAGKTTLIKKLLKESYAGQQVVLIENEFGVENIDAGFLQDSGVEIREISAGCICCSMVGDFTSALKEILSRFHPDRILIEPSGVGKLSDVIRAVEKTAPEQLYLDRAITVVDATKGRIYMRNFGEFYNDQIKYAQGIVLSRTNGLAESRIAACLNAIRELNTTAPVITTPWEQLDGEQIFDAIAGVDDVDLDLSEVLAEMHQQDHEEHEHHQHEHEEHHHDEHCCHDHQHEHEGHHHDHHCHEHHHDHEGHCCCHDHEHHHAEDVFSSWGGETVSTYSKDELKAALTKLDSGELGQILRAKGIVQAAEGGWWHFDYVPESMDIRPGAAAIIGKLCVIGAELQEEALSQLFKRK